MRRWAFLFRPGWLALAGTVLAFAYLCFTVLAPWQLGKNSSTSRENGQIAASVGAEPVPLTSLLPHQDSAAPDAQWRPVTATGHYLPDAQVLVRLRVVDGAPAFEVLVPFTVDHGPTVLVNRGYVRPLEASKVPSIPAPPAERVTVIGRLRDSQQQIPGKDPITENGIRQVYSISTGQIAALTGVPLTGSYLQLIDAQPGGLGALALPHLDAGPFLSYGIQWIAFGIVAPICLGYFVYSEIRVRRAQHSEPEDGSADDAPPPPMTVEQKLADRYGRRR